MKSLKALIIVLILLMSISTYTSSSRLDYNSYEAEYIDDKLIINLYQGGYLVGKALFRPIYAIAQVKQVYDYLIELDIYPSNISEVLDGEPIETYFKINYKFLFANKSIDGDRIFRINARVTLSSFAMGVEDLTNLTIDQLVLTLTSYTLTNSFTIPIDVASILRSFNMPMYIILNLNKYWIEVVTLERDPGWIDYELYTSAGKIGLIRISSNKYFNYSRSMRIWYNLLNKDFRRYINVSIAIEMLIDGRYEDVSYNLSKDNEVILPKEYIDYIDFNNLTIVHLWIIIEVPYGENRFDVIEDIGPVYIYGGKGINIYELDAKIESFKELGNGWLLITLGIYEDIAIDNLKIYFDPTNPEMRPKFSKVFVKEREGDPRYIVNILTFFDDPGVVEGYIIIDLSTPDFIKVKELQFSLLLKEGGEYKTYSYDPEVRTTLIDGKFIIEIPVNKSIKYKDYLVLELTLRLYKDDYKPIKIVYEMDSEPPIQGSTDYFNLKNSTNIGSLQLRFQGEIIKTLRLYPLPPLEEFCEGGLSKGESKIEYIWVYIEEIDSLEVLDIKMTLYKVASPDEYPNICNLPEKEFNPLPLIINVGIPSLAILGSIVISIYVYLRLGKPKAL